jgi:hypothetical protein
MTALTIILAIPVTYVLIQALLCLYGETRDSIKHHIKTTKEYK